MGLVRPRRLCDGGMPATVILRDRLPRTMDAIVLLVASVVLLICAWLV